MSLKELKELFKSESEVFEEFAFQPERYEELYQFMRKKNKIHKEYVRNLVYRHTSSHLTKSVAYIIADYAFQDKYYLTADKVWCVKRF